MTVPTAPTILFEHIPAPVTEQAVRLIEGPTGDRRVWVGMACYDLDGARDLAATIVAAVQIGEQEG